MRVISDEESTSQTQNPASEQPTVRAPRRGAGPAADEPASKKKVFSVTVRLGAVPGEVEDDDDADP